MPDHAPLDRLRQPEYTGENRCLPCTVVNLAIAGAVSTALTAAVSFPAGLAAFLAAAGVVYFRGYLVPGTPTLTARYLPERVLASFGKADAPSYGVDQPSSTSAEGAVDPSSLEAAGVETDDEGVARLTDGFRTARDERLAEVDDPPTAEQVARAFGVDTEDVAVVGGAPACTVDDRLVQWESASAQALDVAAGVALAARFDDWADLDVQTKTAALAGVRALLTSCPDCGGDVTATTETPKTCCRDPSPVLFLTCAACDVRLLERETDTLTDVVGPVESLPTAPTPVD